MNLDRTKIKTILNSAIVIFAIVLIIFAALETLARKKFTSFSYGSCPHEKLPGNNLFYIPAKNCKSSFKHWESDKEIIYETDENNNRVSTMPTNFKNKMTTIAFFGDSFTWGEMNSIDQTYVHYTAITLNELKNKNVGYDNFGVAGYDL